MDEVRVCATCGKPNDRLPQRRCRACNAEYAKVLRARKRDAKSLDANAVVDEVKNAIREASPDSVAALPKVDRLALATEALALGEQRGQDLDVREAEPVAVPRETAPEARLLGGELAPAPDRSMPGLRPDPTRKARVDEPEGFMQVWPSGGLVEADDELADSILRRNPDRIPWSRRDYPNRLPDDHRKPSEHIEPKAAFLREPGKTLVSRELSPRVLAGLVQGRAAFEARRHEDVPAQWTSAELKAHRE